ESRLVELRREEHLFELVHGVLGMLGFHAVVPREESDLQVGKSGRLDVQQAVFKLLPETGRGPVLDREARSLGDSIIFAAEEPDQFVAEFERRWRALLALPKVMKAQPKHLAYGEQPLEMGCLESESTSIDGSLGAHQLRVPLAIFGILINS